MAKNAADIVKNYMAETGVTLSGSSLNLCLKFAEAILQMEHDAKRLQPSLRNCQYYSEERVSKENTISHSMFQKDSNLHAMAEWFLQKTKEGKDVREKPDYVQELEETVKRQKKQIQGLVSTQQNFDNISVDYHRVKMNLVRKDILLKRAMAVLKALGKDNEVNMIVSPEEIGVIDASLINYLPIDKDTGEILGQVDDENIDEQ